MEKVYWHSLLMTLAAFCSAVALWQAVENHGWHRGYFVIGCITLAFLLSCFIAYETPKR